MLPEMQAPNPIHWHAKKTDHFASRQARRPAFGASGGLQPRAVRAGGRSRGLAGRASEDPKEGSDTNRYVGGHLQNGSLACGFSLKPEMGSTPLAKKRTTCYPKGLRGCFGETWGRSCFKGRPTGGCFEHTVRAQEGFIHPLVQDLVHPLPQRC